MGVWDDSNVDWSAGAGLAVRQTFESAYADREAARAVADAVAIAWPVDAATLTHSDLWAALLTAAAKEHLMPALAAELLDDPTRTDFADSLIPILGSQIRLAYAERVAKHGLPEGVDERAVVLTGTDVASVTAAVLPVDGDGQLEANNLTNGGSEDFEAYTQTILNARRRVALVRRGLYAVGSGFLVGPDLLLTAAHVLRKDGPPQPSDLDNIEIVMDYIGRGVAVAETGTTARVTGLLRASPATDAELAGGPLVDWDAPEDHLDYALLRLSRPVGEEPTPETELGHRGWYTLSTIEPDFARSAQVMVLHFPKGKYLTLSVMQGSFQINSTKTRVRYKSNTEPGSSGGPIVDAQGRLLAIHHYGRQPANQAVPIWRVALAIEDLTGPAATIALASIARSGVILRQAQVDDMMESIVFLQEQGSVVFDGVALDARHELRTGRGERYVTLLEDGARRAGNPQAALPVRLCYERQLWVSDALELVRDVGSLDMRLAFQFATDYVERDAPVDVTSALVRAAARGMRGDPRAPLYRFVARLGFTAHVDAVPWLTKELSPKAAQELSQKAKPIGEALRRTMVVFDLREIARGEERRFPLRVHLWSTIPGQESGGWLPPNPDTPCSSRPDAIRAAVEKEIRRLREAGQIEGDRDRSSVGFVLRRGDLDLVPEMWQVDPIGDGMLAGSLAQSFTVLIHLADRFANKSLVRSWKDRLKRIEDFRRDPPEVEWLEQGARLRGLEAMTASCAAFDFVPIAAQGRDDPFNSAVGSGAPFILWSDDEPADRAAVRLFIDSLIGAGELDRIPERLIEADAELKKFGATVRLIWDDKARLPPGLIPEAVDA